jgi:hypothetical protein
VHANSVQVVGQTVLLSLRHTNGIYGIDRRNGAVTWKLGGTTTPQSLQIVDDALGPVPLSGQHFARLLPDGALTVHDNGTLTSRAPRALRFRIDPTARTARVVEQLRDATVATSPCCGSATKLPDGRWLVSWGGQPLVGEYAPGGATIWRLRFRNRLFSYRANPIPPSSVTRARLRAAMNVLNPRR